MTDRPDPADIHRDADTAPTPTRATTQKADPLRSSSTSHVWLALASLAVLLVLLVVFLAQNTTRVRLRFFGWDGHPPLAVALLASVAVGLLLAVIAGSLRIVQLRRRVHRDTKRSRA